jgi:hypothetical protein
MNARTLHLKGERFTQTPTHSHTHILTYSHTHYHYCLSLCFVIVGVASGGVAIGVGGGGDMAIGPAVINVLVPATLVGRLIGTFQRFSISIASMCSPLFMCFFVCLCVFV